jgi:hypothetical protein
VNRLLRSTRGADRAALQPDQKITLPMPWHRAISDLRRTLADQRFRRDMSPGFQPGPRPRHPQRPTPAQATDQLPLERTAAFDIQRLVDGLVANPHGRIIGEIERDPMGDLLRAPRRHPRPITPVRLVAPLPRRYRRPGHDLAIRATNDTGQLVLDVLAQPVVTDQLGRLRTPGTPLAMPLRDRRLVFQPVGSRRSVAAQLTRNRRRRTPQPSRDLTNTGILSTPQSDIFPLA